ncbi:hypothetical protein [Bradyrhizobium sp. CCBAU 53338]|uniref:hypothetical protein n=1 Tax=Bradyrhizobium sp. CCBAU 53338 TaxID=1325111 RepID=UPI00188CEBED|nr:hypothetical protein [Bradyrhizobium sp. CCBAU 53338]
MSVRSFIVSSVVPGSSNQLGVSNPSLAAFPSSPTADWSAEVRWLLLDRPPHVIAPSINVSVQGSPGQSPQDNERLGKSVADAAMVHVRSLIGQELRQQSRPGGVLFRR